MSYSTKGKPTAKRTRAVELMRAALTKAGPKTLDTCPECGEKAPPSLPGPKEPPRQWYCHAHRHLNRRGEFA